MRALLLLVFLAGCGAPMEEEPFEVEVPEGDDAGFIAVEVDAGDDGGLALRVDAGVAPVDSGVPDAAVPTPDAGPPDAGLPDAGAALRIVVLSDLNGSYGSTTYEASVHQAIAAITGTVRPDLVLISGDMVAGQQSGLNYAAMWQGFHAAVTTPLNAAGIPVAPSPGNHDASAYPGYQVERDEFGRQWTPGRRPAVQMIDGAQFPFRYSFVFRGVFFVSLDATTVAPLSGAQRTWVAQQLAAATAYPVRIVYGHVPIHPTTVGRETEVLNDTAFETLLRTHGALFIGGHQHGYFPGASNGVRHVVAPCIGAGPRPLIGTTAPSARGFLVLDVAADRVTSLEMRTGAGFTSTLPRSSLPGELRSGTHLLTRDDRAGF